MTAPVPSQTPSPPVRLAWQTAEGEALERLLGAETLVIGREKDCDISIQHMFVSRHHAKISLQGTGYIVADLGSSNGTYVNKERLKEPHPLQDGDIITIGEVEFRFSQPTPVIEKTLVATAPDVLPYLEIYAGSGKKTQFSLVREKLTIGRAGHGQQWDLMLPDRAVSRPQAQITRQGEDFVLTDLGSANGTLVNGAAISESRVLKDGDAITFGETVLVFHAGSVKS